MFCGPGGQCVNSTCICKPGWENDLTIFRQRDCWLPSIAMPIVDGLIASLSLLAFILACALLAKAKHITRIERQHVVFVALGMPFTSADTYLDWWALISSLLSTPLERELHDTHHVHYRPTHAITTGPKWTVHGSMTNHAQCDVSSASSRKRFLVSTVVGSWAISVPDLILCVLQKAEITESSQEMMLLWTQLRQPSVTCFGQPPLLYWILPPQAPRQGCVIEHRYM